MNQEEFYQHCRELRASIMGNKTFADCKTQEQYLEIKHKYIEYSQTINKEYSAMWKPDTPTTTEEAIKAFEQTYRHYKEE